MICISFASRVFLPEHHKSSLCSMCRLNWQITTFLNLVQIYELHLFCSECVFCMSALVNVLSAVVSSLPYTTCIHVNAYTSTINNRHDNKEQRNIKVMVCGSNAHGSAILSPWRFIQFIFCFPRTMTFNVKAKKINVR